MAARCSTSGGSCRINNNAQRADRNKSNGEPKERVTERHHTSERRRRYTETPATGGEKAYRLLSDTMARGPPRRARRNGEPRQGKG